MANDLTVQARTVALRQQSARALRLGGRLAMAGLEREFADLKVIGRSPLVLRLSSEGFVALFPYGTVVFIGSAAAEQEAILSRLNSRIEDRLDTAAIVETKLEFGASTMPGSDRISVDAESVGSVSIIADALAKNVAIALEEEEVKKSLIALEPFTGDLAESGRLPLRRRKMLQTVGQVFRTHRRLLERVDVEEKPDVKPWNEESAQLWARLAEHYDLRKRARSVSAKLDAIEVMLGGLTDMINAQREIRVELLIVALIAIEIGIWVYESFIQA